MTTTAEVIFAGLMILSLPDRDEKAVVALPDDAHHHLRFVLLQGEATCGGRPTTAPALLDVSPEIALRSPNKTVVRVIYPETSRPLHWVTGAVGRLPAYGEQQSEYLSWLPSLSPMVWGDSRLPGDCRNPSEECPRAKARFFLDRGKLKTCHFVHEHQKPLKIFELPNDEVRALGDAFSFEEEIPDGAAIGLEINGQTCTIMAKDGSDIQLFVSHAPGDKSKGSHFRRVHRLQNWFFQRMDRSHPKFKRVSSSTNYGSCECAVNKALPLLETEAKAAGRDKPRFIHSPTECVPPTQP